jgi:hypothetical protein
MWRTLDYGQSTALYHYENAAGSPAFNAAVGAAWFPGAHVRSDWVSNFGIEGDLDYSLGLKSKQGHKTYNTKAYALGAGLLYRLPLDSFELRARAGYVRRVFDADVPPTVPLPGVSYSSLRYGLGAVVHVVEWLDLDANLAYLYTLSTGELGTKKFAHGVTAAALDFSGGACGSRSTTKSTGWISAARRASRTRCPRAARTATCEPRSRSCTGWAA